MKSAIIRHWPLLGICVLLALLVFYLSNSGKEIINETLFENFIPGEGQVLKDIHFAQENPDKGVSWTLKAGEVRATEDKNIINFRKFNMKVRSKDRPSFELRGDQGDYYRDSGQINLQGNLEGISEDGYRIIANQMVMNEKSSELSSESPVKIFGPFFSVEGQGLFVDLEKEAVKIPLNVTARIKVGQLQ